MSGICGITYYNTELSLDTDLELMSSHIKPCLYGSTVRYKEFNTGILSKGNGQSPTVTEPFKLLSGEILVSDGTIENKEEIMHLTGMSLSETYAPDDTEIIAAAYHLLGNNCIHVLKGQYAFVVYNPASRKFTFGRDQSGEAPLFYTFKRNKYLAFASEIQSLLALPIVEEKLDGNQMVKFIMSIENKTFPAGKNTLYQHIYSVPPENCLEIGPESIWTKIDEHTSDELDLKFNDTHSGFWPGT